MDAPIRFKEFTFHHEIGELVRRDGSGREFVTRLAPQPSKLLLLLLENYPGIVSQQEIKDSLWPDVQVDYEQSLHYCIRQIRSSLNDNAANPRFIETVPRRGYRWIAGFERRTYFTSPRLFVIAAIAIGSLLLYFLIPGGKAVTTDAPDGSAQARIAVMPFQPREESNDFQGNDIAFQLVESLTNGHKDNYQIIGPTTTANYQPGQLRALIRDFDIDCIINGKFSQLENTSRLLAEIIRAEDGAHIWVRYFDSGTDRDTIIAMITAGLLEQFGPEPEEQ